MTTRTDTEQITVKVLLNITTPFRDDITPRTRFTRAGAFTVTTTATTHTDAVQQALDGAYDLGNLDVGMAYAADPDTGMQVATYRADRQRSISVGDVLVATEGAWMVAPMGMRPVTISAEQIVTGHWTDF